MKACQRCGRAPSGEFGLHDYCAKCSRDLCDGCMAEGCCGAVPALSGSEADYTPACEECGRLMGHNKTCSKKPKRPVAIQKASYPHEILCRCCRAAERCNQCGETLRRRTRCANARCVVCCGVACKHVTGSM